LTTPEFERKFLKTATQFLRCRLELIPLAREAEGAMLGMWDWRGEMRIVCQEQTLSAPENARDYRAEGPRSDWFIQGVTPLPPGASDSALRLPGGKKPVSVLTHNRG